MLRLKKVLLDCGIQQKALVDATGFGKSQISLTLSTGKLPADAEKFKSGIVNLVHQEPMLQNWLSTHHYNIERLFETLLDDSVGAPLAAPEAEPNLTEMIYNLAGRATIDGGLSRLAALRLLRALHFVCLASIPGVKAAAAAILAGGEP